MEFSEEATRYRIIFLDIDGVLGRGFPKVPVTQDDVDKLDTVAIMNLMFIITAISTSTNDQIGIVISSTWKESGNIEYLQKIFQKTPFAIYILDKTPSLKPMHRNAEIMSWLYRNVDKYLIKNFIILDDYPVGLDLFKERYIQINQKKLLTSSEVNKAVDIMLSSSHRITRGFLDRYGLDLSPYEDYKDEGCTVM